MRYYLSLIALLGGLMWTSPALGEVSTRARAELAYAHYEADYGSGQKVDASSFTQQYSVMRNMGGELAGGRLGKYSFGLGAEWNLADFEVNGRDGEIDTFKALYRGSVTLAPGGLPFRLAVYSRDVNGSRWMNDSNLSANNSHTLLSGGRGSLISPDIITGIANGQQVETGVQMWVGIQNGSYRGRWRNSLSKLPRLLMDYKEVNVRDVKGVSPRHYRSRDLAFVSLNKKDNWLHYRIQDYTDFLDASNDTRTDVIMIGTIDQYLHRNWINLTNWIKISADLSFTEEFSVKNQGGKVARYDLNLFTRARRAKWSLSNPNTFSRSMEGEMLSRKIDIPVLLNGNVDRNTGYRFRAVGTSNAFSGVDLFERRVDTVSTSLQVETYRTRRYTLMSDLSVDVKEGTEGRGVTAQASMELRSNRRFDPKYDLLGSYSVKRFGGTGSNGKKVEYWEHEAVAKASTDLTSSLRSSMSQRFVYGTGTVENSVSSSIQASGTEGLSGSAQTNAGASGRIFRSMTNLSLSHRSAMRMRNALGASFDYLSNDGSSKVQTALSHTLSYQRRRWSLTIQNAIAFGSGMQGNGVGVSSGSVRRSLSHDFKLGYSPGRAWETDLALTYDKKVADEGAFSSLSGEQRYRYSLFSINGIVRKLFQLDERFQFVRNVDLSNATVWAGELSLGGTYFPTKRTLLGLTIKYQTGSDPSDYQDIALALSAGANFQKLSANVEYQYGTRSIDGGELSGDQDEQRWEIRVKKTF